MREYTICQKNKYKNVVTPRLLQPLPIPCAPFIDTSLDFMEGSTSIVSDKDQVFYRRFWKEMFSIQGINLFYLSVYHPLTDGQTGIVNKCIENYLRCMTGNCPKQ